MKLRHNIRARAAVVVHNVACPLYLRNIGSSRFWIESVVGKHKDEFLGLQGSQVPLDLPSSSQAPPAGNPNPSWGEKRGRIPTFEGILKKGKISRWEFWIEEILFSALSRRVDASEGKKANLRGDGCPCGGRVWAPPLPKLMLILWLLQQVRTP